MTELDQFRSNLRDMVDKSEQEASEREAEQKAREERRHQMLLAFDTEADEIQDDIVAPRIKYLASLFDHAFEPEMREEHEYRHRIHLHFAHTAEFPCTADVTFYIVHSDMPEFLKVKFEYIILPAYMTDRFKSQDEIQVSVDDSARPAVKHFVETCLETFTVHYLKAKRV